MMDLLLPFRALDEPVPYNFVPAFLTKERLRLCWEHVSQIRGLLPQSYCRPHAHDRHPFDNHPLQDGVPLFYFTLKMRFQYREPNPWSRRLASPPTRTGESRASTACCSPTRRSAARSPLLLCPC